MIQAEGIFGGSDAILDVIAQSAPPAAAVTKGRVVVLSDTAPARITLANTAPDDADPSDIYIPLAGGQYAATWNEDDKRLTMNIGKVYQYRASQYDEAWQEADAYMGTDTAWAQISYAPPFYYGGTMTAVTEKEYGGETYYQTELLTGGTLMPPGDMTVDISLIGGGGGGGAGNGNNGGAQGGGGGGGYTASYANVQLDAGVSYIAVIGAGGGGGQSMGATAGTDGEDGGETSFDTFSVQGGAGGKWGYGSTALGGAGGSGGGGGSGANPQGYAGGTNGGDGNGPAGGAQGQGTTTRDFADAFGALRAGGGSGGGRATGNPTPGGAGGGADGATNDTPAADATANYGGGGGGGAVGGGGATGTDTRRNGGMGGSGAAVIRWKKEEA
jgi:hypothetical protein